MSIAEKLLEELRSKEDLKKALAEELLPALASDRELRLLMITSILRDVATKEDLRDLEDRLRREIDGLRREVNDLAQRVLRLEGSIGLLVRLFIAFNVPMLIGIIEILLKW